MEKILCNINIPSARVVINMRSNFNIVKYFFRWSSILNHAIWWAFDKDILGLSWKKWPHYSQSGQKWPNLVTLFIKFVLVESSKLHDSKCYSTLFFMYFQPMITIFPPKNYLTMLKFGLMLITTLALLISILHHIFTIPSCSECQKVSFYGWNHVIWSSFEQDTVPKPTFPYFFGGLVQKKSF